MMSKENKMNYKTKRFIAFGIGVVVAIIIGIIIIISIVAHQKATVQTPTGLQLQQANQANQEYADSKIDAMGNSNSNSNSNSNNTQSQSSKLSENQIMQTAFSGGQITQEEYDSLNSAQKQDFNSSEAIVRHLSTGESYNSAYIKNPNNSEN